MHFSSELMELLRHLISHFLAAIDCIVRKYFETYMVGCESVRHGNRKVPKIIFLEIWSKNLICLSLFELILYSLEIFLKKPGVNIFIRTIFITDFLKNLFFEFYVHPPHRFAFTNINFKNFFKIQSIMAKK